MVMSKEYSVCKKCNSAIKEGFLLCPDCNNSLTDIEIGVHYILKGLQVELGIDTMDVNFKDTPERVAKAYKEIFSGSTDTKKQLQEVLSSKFPSEGYDQIVLCTGIVAHSMCPHHLLPVEYNIDIGYLVATDGYVLGVSKLARICQILTARPVLQETATQELGLALSQLKGGGVMIIMKGKHYCMRMRGVKQQSSITTSYVSGAFKDNPSTKEEFLQLIRKKEV